MAETILILFEEYFRKLTSIALKTNLGYMTMEESRVLLKNLNEKTVSRIHRIRISNFVTDN